MYRILVSDTDREDLIEVFLQTSHLSEPSVSITGVVPVFSVSG